MSSTTASNTFKKPCLFHGVHNAQSVVEIIDDPNAFQGKRAKYVCNFAEYSKKALNNGCEFTVDFGTHYVGNVTLKLSVIGINDSPCRLQLTFGEIPAEVEYPFEQYNGWLNNSWIYQETVTADVLPSEIKLPRRYAFRYIKIKVLGSRMSYSVLINDIFVEATTSADLSKVQPLPLHADPLLKQIDCAAVKTLSECMQEVYEDGPKRDRRLWIGDMRLQALANYKVFGDTSVVKYCIDLFASTMTEGGFVSPCFYTLPVPHPDVWYFVDYSLFFVSCLFDYYRFSEDMDYLRRHWHTACNQLELAAELFDDSGVLKDHSRFFVDWCPGLDKYVSAVSITIYVFRQALILAKAIGDIASEELLQSRITLYTSALVRDCYDESVGCFISGKQISLCSQSWAALANVLDDKRLLRAMEVGEALSETPKDTTPYMKHTILEAYWLLGRKQRVIDIIKEYWGEMIRYGADTFFEVFRKDDHTYSTGEDKTSYMTNSYCHAWSCTPCLFIREYYSTCSTWH